MARKTQTVNVDGDAYQVTQLPIEEGLELYDELLRSIGGGLSRALAAGGGGEGDIETKIGAAFVGSLGSLPPGMLSRIGKRFAKHTKVLTVAGENTLAVALNDEMYEDQFAGRLGHWSRWVIACLRLNFADFLPASGSAGSPKAEAATAK